MNNRKAFFLAFLALCMVVLTLAPAVAAQHRPSPAFQSPLPTPPMCPLGQTRPDCLPWRPTPPPATPTPGAADVDQMRYVFLPLVLR